MSTKYFRFQVNGIVQGVNFRQWTKKQGAGLGVTGYIRNHDQGHVEGEALGATQAMDNFKALLRKGPPHAEVSSIDIMDEKTIESPDEIGWKFISFEVRR